jgi:hypothetical protein
MGQFQLRKLSLGKRPVLRPLVRPNLTSPRFQLPNCKCAPAGMLRGFWLRLLTRGPGFAILIVRPILSGMV